MTLFEMGKNIGDLRSPIEESYMTGMSEVTK